MKVLFKGFTIIAIAILFTNCAATYRQINPQSINYSSHDLQDGISFSYQYDVLRLKNNKKYAKKEQKRNVRIIAVKITNNTDSVITMGKDAIFYSGQNEVIPMTPFSSKESIKQYAAGYLPYLLFTPTKLFITKPNQGGGYTTETYPIGYAIGPGLTAGNMIMASSSNEKMLSEFIQYDVLNKEIQPNETIYGIIGLNSFSYSPLSVKLKK